MLRSRQNNDDFLLANFEIMEFMSITNGRKAFFSQCRALMNLAVTIQVYGMTWKLTRN